MNYSKETMEAKLKALKVVELKELLTRAKIPIPGKANKPDLINLLTNDKNIDAARAVFEELHGGGSVRPSGASTPRPPPAQDGGAEKAKPAARPQENEDILAPPEPFDWSAGAEATTNAAAEPPSKPPKTTSAKPASKKEPAPTTTKATSQTPSTAVKATSKVGEPATAEDEEMKKRRARAERFGIPLVTPEQTQPVKETRRTPAGPKQSPAATAPNGKAAKTKVPKAAKPIEEDAEKLKARAMRFGLPEKVTHVKPSSEGVARVTGQANPPATKGGTGQKRGAPEETIDGEEAERRRKRAERFGFPTKT